MTNVGDRVNVAGTVREIYADTAILVLADGSCAPVSLKSLDPPQAGSATMTVDEAAAYLDPPVTARQLATLIGALPGLVQAGTRPVGRGRPPAVYDVNTLMDLHACLARWL